MTCLKRFAVFFGVLLMFFVAVYTPSAGPPSVAFAATGSLDMDHSDVMDDLSGSMVDGEVFDVTKYAFDESKNTAVLFLAEYCYSFYASKRGNYNLYLYVWNPKGLHFISDSSLNHVELSFGEANRVPFAKYRLTCVSVSTQKNYEGLFYKFRVELTTSQKEAALKAMNSSERIYHVSSIELMENGGNVTSSFYVNTVFTYSGYSVGYGPNEGGDTLSYMKSKGEALDIERQGGLHTTFFRPQGASSPDGYTQDTLQSVYFSVPERYFEDDYKLVAARMEWLFAQTQYGLVTGNQEVYTSLLSWIGQTGGTAEGQRWLNSNGQPFPAEYGFNGHFGTFNGNRDILSDMQYLAFLFPTDEWKTDSADNYIVPWEEILQWMRDYHEEFDSEDKTYWDPDYERTHLAGQNVPKGINVNFHRPYNGELVNVNGVEYPYSRALFSYIASDKTTMDITADKTFSLLDLKISERLKWLDDGYFVHKDKYVSGTHIFDNINAIKIVENSDFRSTEEATCLGLYIDNADYDDFKSFYDEAIARNEKVVLVRYDVSKYYSCEASEGILKSKDSLVTGYDRGDTNARIFSMGVYLGLDLIHLEFNNGDVSFFLPVVSTPIDAGSDSTPAIDTNSDGGCLNVLELILLIVTLILILIILWPILPYIIKAVVWVVLLPFRLIGMIVKAIQNAAKKRRRNDKE